MRAGACAVPTVSFTSLDTCKRSNFSAVHIPPATMHVSEAPHSHNLSSTQLEM